MCSSAVSLLTRGEVLVERVAVGVAARRRGSRSPQAARRLRVPRRCPLAASTSPLAVRSSSAATSDDTTSWASVSVFIRNTSSRARQRHTKVEHRRLHCVSSRTANTADRGGDSGSILVTATSSTSISDGCNACSSRRMPRRDIAELFGESAIFVRQTPGRLLTRQSRGCGQPLPARVGYGVASTIDGYSRVISGLASRRSDELAETAKLLARLSSAAQSFRKLTHVELVHLVLQRTQRDSKVLRRPSDVPAAFLERAKNEVPLERVGRVLEQAVGARCPAARAARSGTRAAGPLPRCSPCR